MFTVLKLKSLNEEPNFVDVVVEGFSKQAICKHLQRIFLSWMVGWIVFILVHQCGIPPKILHMSGNISSFQEILSVSQIPGVSDLQIKHGQERTQPKLLHELKRKQGYIASRFCASDTAE